MLVEIIRDFGITKDIASIAVTGSFITYGAGQLISGIIGDRIPPRTMIAAGLCATSFINLSMSLLSNIALMTFLWCFNGFFQSMIWPPLTRMMVENLDDAAYARVCTMVNASASVSTIAVYLFAPTAIIFAGWQLVFTVAGFLGLFTVLFWLIGTYPMRKVRNKEAHIIASEKSEKTKACAETKSFKTGLLVMIMAAILLQGILRDGITTWMPAYITEVFSLGSSSSILMTIILPIFSIFSITVTSFLQKKLNNELKTSSLLYALALAASMVLLPLFQTNVICAALLMAVITGCMHGINLMLISHLPKHFARFGRVSTISGTLNTCTYIGSAVSTYCFAVLSERFGWSFIIVSWAVISAVGFVLCALCIPKWSTFRLNNK